MEDPNKLAELIANKLIEKLEEKLKEGEEEEKKETKSNEDSIIDDKVLKALEKLDELETKRLIRRAIIRRLVRIF